MKERMKKKTNRCCVSGCSTPQPNHISGNAQHRRESGKPTKEVRPKWIFVTQIFNWCPLNYVENEYTLKGKVVRSTWNYRGL